MPAGPPPTDPADPADPAGSALKAQAATVDVFGVMGRSTSCALPDARNRSGELRGRWWLIASFVFCPCHLPVTLGVIALLGGGTALGSFARGNGVVIGVAVTALWLAGTARGFWLIRQADRAASSALARSG